MIQRVFIASTSEDLEAYRLEAIDVIRELKLIPVHAEGFDPHADAGIVEACRQEVVGSDLVLAIVAWRRGWVPEPERGGNGRDSITKLEIDFALSRKPAPVPVTVLMADRGWPTGLCEEEPEARAYMRNFRGSIDRLARPFRHEGDTRPLDGFAKLVWKTLRDIIQHDTLPRPAEPLRVKRRPPSPRELPVDRPYPLLRPYEHTELFAGRERELSEVERLLRQPIPILGIHSRSGAGKSSLLCAGLVPALESRGQAVALDRHPDDPGLANRLLAQLLEPESGNASERLLPEFDPDSFVAHLSEARRLGGNRPPVLILDQFEDLFRYADRGDARATVGALLAATAQAQPGLADPLCRWVLAYRGEHHGEVVAWLHDVLRDAREKDLPRVDHLPHDLSTDDRFHEWPLPPFGSPPFGVPAAESEEAVVGAFQAAIEKPLRIAVGGGRPRYPYRFEKGGAERLAKSFARARMKSPDAALVPELQVVLALLLERAERPDAEGSRTLPVGDEPEQRIDEALKRHLDGVLGRIAREIPDEDPRRQRSRVLLALQRLADAQGRRGPGRPTSELDAAIGNRGRDVLELLSDARSRILVPQNDAFELSHDRMAEVVVGMVEEEGAHDRLLALQRVVDLNTELHRRGKEDEKAQSTRISRAHFKRIRENPGTLLWDPSRREWWEACRRRRSRDRRRWVTSAALVAVVAAAAGWGFWQQVVGRAEVERRLGEIGSQKSEAVIPSLALFATKFSSQAGKAREALAGRKEPVHTVFESLAENPDPGQVADAVEVVLPAGGFLEGRRRETRGLHGLGARLRRRPEREEERAVRRRAKLTGASSARPLRRSRAAPRDERQRAGLAPDPRRHVHDGKRGR